ncbi:MULTISPECIES: hypothetical protein [unclassified Microbacterium]|uniref:hypothetical protein n=1 Tax=unclassified Microbacterium TaxID=2609290 RepID=UPI00301B4062
MTDRPEIVCICGSARFTAEMRDLNRDLTFAGIIVLAPGEANGPVISAQEPLLALLHLRKIDLADRVMVVNPGGYIGESTRREVAYARAAGKPVAFTHPEAAEIADVASFDSERARRNHADAVRENLAQMASTAGLDEVRAAERRERNLREAWTRMHGDAPVDAAPLPADPDPEPSGRTSERPRYITIDIPVRLWLLIDGCIDNSMAIDAVEGDVVTLMNGAVVREAGWRAAADSEPDPSAGWPPAEHLLHIVLPRSHWEWTAEQVDRWQPYQAAIATAGIVDVIAEALDAE